MLIAAAACEMHPDAVLAASELRAVARELARCTAGAAEVGVLEVPAVVVGERVFLGERALEEAGACMARTEIAQSKSDAVRTHAAESDGPQTTTPSAGK